MALSFATADAVLKEDYHGPVVDQLNNANILLAQVEQNTEDIVGRRFVTPLHLGRNAGVGARAERGTLPTAGNQRYKDIFGPVRSMYARIELSGQVISAMSKDRGSFIRALDSEMSGAVDDAKRDYCRQLWGESNGRLASCGVTTAAALVVLAATTRQDQIAAIEEFMDPDGLMGSVDIGTLANPTLIASNRAVTAVDYTNLTITISGAVVTTTAAHFVFRHGAGGASDNSGNPGDGQKELTGIQTMVSDTAILHTVNPSTETRWKATVDANGGTLRSISETLVNKNIMSTERKSGGIINLLVGSDGVYRSYANQLVSLKRFMDTVELKGGYSAVSVGTATQKGTTGGKGLALTWDRDCPNNRLYGLTTKDFTFMVMQDWQWMDKTGAVLLQVADQDAYNATMKKYGEFVLRRRNSQFQIADVTES